MFVPLTNDEPYTVNYSSLYKTNEEKRQFMYPSTTELDNIFTTYTNVEMTMTPTVSAGSKSKSRRKVKKRRALCRSKTSRRKK